MFALCPGAGLSSLRFLSLSDNLKVSGEAVEAFMALGVVIDADVFRIRLVRSASSCLFVQGILCPMLKALHTKLGGGSAASANTAFKMLLMHVTQVLHRSTVKPLPNLRPVLQPVVLDWRLNVQVHCKLYNCSDCIQARNFFASPSESITLHGPACTFNISCPPLTHPPRSLQSFVVGNPRTST